MTVTPDSTEITEGSDGPIVAAPSKRRRLARNVVRVLGGALLIVVGILSPLMGLTMAMFSEGLKEPWRGTPQAVLWIGLAFGAACIVAAVGVIRGRRWGTILAAGAIVALVLVTSIR